VIEALEKNDLTALDLLCSTSIKQLTDIEGIVLGQAKRIEKFCHTAEPKPVELGDVNKLSELDLLKKLAETPDDANVLDALRTKRLVQKAEERTNSWAVVDMDEAGVRKLDAQATYEYLKHITLATQPPLLNKTREGKLIEAVEILGKADGEFLLHPLFDEQCITNGYDDTRLDWSKVPQETMKALLWARKTIHENFARLNLDADRIYAEVAKGSVDDVFIKGILDDYRLALKKKDRRALYIDLTPTESELEACKKTLNNNPADGENQASQSRSTSESFTNSIGIKFVKIPTGTFILGTDCIPNAVPGCNENEIPPQVIQFKQPFYSRITQ